jgi:hypothetical protein
MSHTLLSLRLVFRQAQRGSSKPSIFAAAPLPSISSQCLRLQYRQYASKAKLAKRSSASKATSTIPVIAPVAARSRPAQATPTPASSATNTYVEPMSLFVQTVASRPSPTLLYLAPASNAHPISCLAVAGFSLAYGAFHFYDAFLVAHPGLWAAVPYMMGGVSIFMIGIGTWVGLGAQRLVGSLSAVPAHLALRSSAASGGGVILRMEPRKILPFWSPKTVETNLSDMRLGSRVTPLVKGEDMKGRMHGRQDRRVMAIKRSEEVEKQTLGGIIVQYSGIPWLMKSASGWIGRLIGREGFANLIVNGKAWKIDARQGWLLDDGQALDRLLKARVSS